MHLAEIQQQFELALTGQASEFRSMICGGLGADLALDIYRVNSRLILESVLLNQFGYSAYLVGRRRFRRYISSFISKDGVACSDLNDLGALFYSWLKANDCRSLFGIARFRRARFGSATFRGATFRGATFRGATLNKIANETQNDAPYSDIEFDQQETSSVSLEALNLIEAELCFHDAYYAQDEPSVDIFCDAKMTADKLLTMSFVKAGHVSLLKSNWYLPHLTEKRPSAIPRCEQQEGFVIYRDILNATSPVRIENVDTAHYDFVKMLSSPFGIAQMLDRGITEATLASIPGFCARGILVAREQV